MWSETLPYRGYRVPYLPRFFARSATRLRLNGQQRLIDLACGTGGVAFGFAPYVSHIVGVDSELPMLEAARRESEAGGKTIELIHSRIEELDTSNGLGRFDLITIGRAHFWLEADAVISKLDALLSDSGRIFICLSVTDTRKTVWSNDYWSVMRRWAVDFPFERLRVTPRDFLRDSPFEFLFEVTAIKSQRLTVEHLANRAFGFPHNSRARLGAAAPEFIAALESALVPHSRNGVLTEVFHNIGMVFGRADAGAVRR